MITLELFSLVTIDARPAFSIIYMRNVTFITFTLKWPLLPPSCRIFAISADASL